MIFLLFFSLQALAGPLTEKWSATVSGSPVAAFFDAGSASVFVSVAEGRDSRVDKFDLSGKLVKQEIVSAKGAAGPLRAHFGKLYWVAGDTLWRFDPEAGKKEKLGQFPESLGKPADIAVARNGSVYLGLSGGTLYEIHAGNGSIVSQGSPISGLFLLDTALYILRERKLETYSLDGKKVGFQRPFCQAKCSGLEKSSGGSWITSEGMSLREFSTNRNRVLLQIKEVPGRFAYVYDREPSQDFLIVPFPAGKILRAYRFR
ncbi:MAG: hypothetical protein AB7K68_11345 [Bacteriovoracia bacterium]